MNAIKLLFVMLLSAPVNTLAQDPAADYLKSHHYAFSIDTGFSKEATALLTQTLAPYKIVFLGEGGSHYLRFYEPLQTVWLRLLGNHFGTNHFFMETGHSSDVLYNHFLQTGDTSFLPKPQSVRNKAFLAATAAHNTQLPAGKKLVSIGIDFERASAYLRALKLLIAGKEPTSDIAEAVKLITTSNETLNNCDYILSINKTLKKELSNHRESFKSYLQEHFDDFEYIITNNGNCSDALKNRNANMAANILHFDKKIHARMYYAQLGMAHTILNNKSTAALLNKSEAFSNQVCVINTWCLNCNTEEEAVSNWQLKGIEKDIQDKLVQYCVSDFTLFDFTGSHPFAQSMKQYGQFLIVARNQRQ